MRICVFSEEISLVLPMLSAASGIIKTCLCGFSFILVSLYHLHSLLLFLSVFVAF